MGRPSKLTDREWLDVIMRPFTGAALSNEVEVDAGVVGPLLAKHLPDAEAQLLERAIRDETAADFGFVYVFKGTHSGLSRYKIGKANRIEDRRRIFAVKLPFDIELVAAFRVKDPRGLESELHRLFQEDRVGGEWFDLDAEGFKRVCLQGVAREIGDLACVLTSAVEASRNAARLSDAEYIEYLEALLALHGVPFDSDRRKQG